MKTWGQGHLNYVVTHPPIRASNAEDAQVDSGYTGSEYTGQSGVDYIHERYYQDEEDPHLAVRTKISDHCPVWAEFDVTKADDE